MGALFTLPGITHFSLDEVRCPCCDTIKLIPAVITHLTKLEELRTQYGKPIIINSGFRCPKHNAEVGGAPSSWHLLFATDIRPDIGNESDLMYLYKLALAANWGGIGLYEGRIHLDIRPEPTRWRG